MDGSKRCSRAKGIFNSVCISFIDNCRRFLISFIPDQHNTSGVAIACPMFRPQRRLLRNKTLRFNLSYNMRPPFPYHLSARLSCTSPVFNITALPSRHESFCPALHTHTTVFTYCTHAILILNVCTATVLAISAGLPLSTALPADLVLTVNFRRGHFRFAVQNRRVSEDGTHQLMTTAHSTRASLTFPIYAIHIDP